MGLQRYHAKRDFRVTPEPRGRVRASAAKGLQFVIQKHDASHLHYDFRLELDGVLLSWAVPKGPSFDPADKRLAMHVEDHPIEYGGFEGIIPEKQYGGGTVMVWDRGEWIPRGDPHEGYRKGSLKFELKGEKLHGSWALVRTRGTKYGGKREAWLLIKEKDDFARTGIDARIVESEPDSVATGRSIEQIARAKENVWHSNKSVAANVKEGAVARKPAKKEKKAKARQLPLKLPRTLSPALATLVSETPTGDGWVHEIKYDGYRMLARLERGKCRIFSRNGKDWTAKLPGIAAEVEKLEAESAWIDGEACVLDEEGRSSFQALQNAFEDEHGRFVFFAFDLPWLDGRDLRALPLLERKRILRELLEGSKTEIKYSIDAQGSGADFHAQACRLGLEGVVSKRGDSTYADGLRTRDWVKSRCSQRQEMVIGGFSEPQGSRQGFGALLLGVYDKGGLRYAGKVGTGFDDETLVDLRRRLDRLRVDEPAFANPPRGYEAKGARWVKPALVAEVEFKEWSREGALRQAAFLGLRKDKKAAEVKRERPVTAAAAKGGKAVKKKSAKATGSADVVAGVKLSNADKQLYPEAKLTKRDLAHYYETVAERMLPHLRGRPLSLVRCPDGRHKECFYQKHADRSVHASVSRVEVPEKNGKATYFSAGSVSALVGLVQWGALELHPWGSRTPDLAHPDVLVFDFDPDDAVTWKKLAEGVKVLRTLLDKLGLRAFLKTTGGKGLHVVVPVRPTLEWETAKAFTRAVATLLATSLPDRFTSSMSKEKRKGKVFVDYLRNAEGATAIAPYAFRARENAPVSMPVPWTALDGKDIRFDHFNVKNAVARMKAMRGDPWKDFGEVRQKITPAMLKSVGA